MKCNKQLPDVSKWRPTSNKEHSLKNELMMTCQFAQKRIVARAQAEIALNIHNFDSGSGVEDIVREELASLLPKRYSVAAGVVNDRSGKTAGDCDMVIRDNLWSPVIKPGATTSSRRFHFPVEGIYAAIEIKQTLGFNELDEAMKKLVTLSRLDRYCSPYGQITENQHIDILDKEGLILNPLHTTVFATRLQDGMQFEEIVERFGAINKSLDRNSMIKMLCVLDHGTAWYSKRSGIPYDADFMRDRNQELVMQINTKEPNNAFYRLYHLLTTHLTRSVLSLTDVPIAYGSAPPERSINTFPDAVFNRLPDKSS